MDFLKNSKEAVNRSAQIIKSGGVVIFPTDTVYGFLTDAKNKKAVDKIYKIKKRSKLKPMPIFVSDIKMAKNLAEINIEQTKILKKYWPGKYTFILKRKKGLSLYDGAKDTVALRIPKYETLNSLLKKINKPLVQTSVNISGQEPLLKSAEIINQFQNFKNLLFVDAGNLRKSKSSKIIDLTKNKINILRK